MTEVDEEYYLNPDLNCESCSQRNKIKFGDDYANTPCSVCALKRNVPRQHKQIITPEHNQALISFIQKLLYVCRNEKRKEILFMLLRYPHLRDKEIAERLVQPRRNVSYHTKLIRRMLPELLKQRSL